MLDVKKYGNFKGLGKSNKKFQIVLVHTSRNIDDYLKSISNRFNGKYNKVPHYLIKRDGEILSLLSNKEYINFFKDEKINKNTIIISLENLGWLNKEPLKDYYVNWIGDIYNGNVVDKKWRDYFFWQPYTDLQIKSTVFLCNKLFDDMGIKKKVIGHNTKINRIENFEGVATRSNYNINFTDLSPAFDFDYFINLIDHE